MTNDNMATLFGVAAVALSGAAVALGIFGAKKAGEAKIEARNKAQLALCDLEDGKITEDVCDLTVKEAKKNQILKTVSWYMPAAACEIASIACIFTGQKYLVKENNMLLDKWHCRSEPKEVFELVRTEDIASLDAEIPVERSGRRVARDG